MDSGLWLLAIIGGFFLLILWICLPFAVFGIQKSLDSIVVELKKMNSELAATRGAHTTSDKHQPRSDSDTGGAWIEKKGQ